MLQALGIDRDDEAVYRALVRVGEGRSADLAGSAGLPTASVTAAVARLEAIGLVTVGPGDQVAAVRPDLAIQALVAEREAALQRSAAAARALATEYRAERPEPPHVDVADIVRGRAELQARYRQLQLGAREEVLTFDRPPYVATLGVNDDEIEHLARGAASRGLYAAAALDVPGQLDWLRAAVAAGEQARVLPDLPLKMSIADRKVALLPLTMDPASVGTIGLLIGPSALLDALVVLFETLWERAVPLDRVLSGSVSPLDAADPEPAVDAPLLALLAAGLTDDAIGRQLAVSPRTVRRRVAALMERLDARTRFQAGLQARARNWL
jgi:hypothetical protein